MVGMPRGARDLTVEQFVAEWRGRNLSERTVAHAHFIELCRLLDVPAPHDNREDDATYCFDARTAAPGSAAYAAARADEAGELRFSPVIPAGDSWGFADVWKAKHFCWEYKRQGKHANLAAALRQLKEYKDSLDNPPLLIVCDIDHFEVHTNFTGYPSEDYRFTLEELTAPKEWKNKRVESPIHLLRRCFTDPDSFKPKKTVDAVTEERAAEVGEIARVLTDITGNDPLVVAHFLMQMVFGFFAEDAGLLPGKILTELLSKNYDKPEKFEAKCRDLFAAMASKGGTFGTHDIEWFNGGLFKDVAKQRFPLIPVGYVGKLSVIAQDDWSAIEPSILGTLFERSLNPAKRSQIGAHYTSRDDILLIIDPVVMAPLRREWEEVKRKVGALAGTGLGGAGAPSRRSGTKRTADQPGSERPAHLSGSERPAHLSGSESPTHLLQGFVDRLGDVKILDPACGSGNFLYVAIQRLLDLEKEVVAFASQPEIGAAVKRKVRPTQLHGIEINEYAAELARVSIWIGYLKWQRENGVPHDQRPILDALDTIENRDAILDLTDPEKPKAAAWPEAEFIVGNPPFLGSKLFRKWGMTDKYIDAIHEAFDLPRTSDLCCYWFELARRKVREREREREEADQGLAYSPRKAYAVATVEKLSSASRNAARFLWHGLTDSGFSMARPCMCRSSDLITAGRHQEPSTPAQSRGSTAT